jgi:hypothetical protein
MLNPNKHIEEYLKYFLSSEVNPEFAVLLQGEWGCGKTWFIKNFLKGYLHNDSNVKSECAPLIQRKWQSVKKRFVEDISKENLQRNDLKCLYISLYGVSSCGEIDDEIFSQLHPILSSKKMALAGKIFKSCVSAGLKFDLPDNINPSEFFKKIENFIIVFDDLERCALELNKTLGYINSFVEDRKSKVIILANEEELHAIENKIDNINPYTKIKEKLIGKTFRVNHDVNSAFESFVTELEKKDIKMFLKERKEKIIDVFKMADYRNLRHLKQSLWDFERFYSSIPSKYTSISELMEDILKYFLAFSFEIKKGKITPSDIKDLHYYLVREIISKDKNKEILPIDEIAKKYTFISIFENLLPGNYWIDLFDKGYLSEDDINASFSKSKYCQDETTPPWVKLWHYLDLDDNEFIQVLKTVEDQWNKKEFKIPGEILHVSGLFLTFSKLELISRTSAEVLTDCKQYINEIKKEGNIHKYRETSGSDRFDKGSWSGLGYAEENSDAFKKIESYLETKMDESEEESYPSKANDMLDILSKDSREFCKMLYFNNESDSTYYKNPILKHIDTKSFFEIFMSLKNHEKPTVLYALSKRYEFINAADKLCEEISFLKELNSLTTDAAQNNKGKISGKILDRINSQYLSKMIIEIESLKNVEGKEYSKISND